MHNSGIVGAMPKFHWSYGLSQFLNHSNEDAVYSNYIGQLTESVARRLGPACRRAIRIADLGCGRASKAVLIAQYLYDRGITTNWDLVDIDERWNSAYQETLSGIRTNQALKFNVHCPVAIETWLHSLKILPDIAQFIQVPYDDESEEMVYNATIHLTSRQSFVLISAEHPNSDLNVIRRRISTLGYSNLPSQRATSLAKRLRKAGLIVKSHVVGRKYLDIGQIDQIAEADWFWDVIFGNKRDICDKSRLLDLVKNIGAPGYIPSLRATLLHAPDFIVSVRQRG
jgi:hypothetical protein